MGNSNELQSIQDLQKEHLYQAYDRICQGILKFCDMNYKCKFTHVNPFNKDQQLILQIMAILSRETGVKFNINFLPLPFVTYKFGKHFKSIKNKTTINLKHLITQYHQEIYYKTGISITLKEIYNEFYKN